MREERVEKSDLEKIVEILEARGYVAVTDIESPDELGTQEYMRGMAQGSTMLTFGTGDKGDSGAYCTWRFNLSSGVLTDIASYSE